MNTKNKEVLPDLMKMDLKLKAFPLPIKPTWRMRAFRYISTLIGLIAVLYPQYFAYYPYYVTQYTDIPKLEEATVLEGALLMEPATSKYGNQIGAHHYVVTNDGKKMKFQWYIRYWHDTDTQYRIKPLEDNGAKLKIWYHEDWGVLQAVFYDDVSHPNVSTNSFKYEHLSNVLRSQKERGPNSGHPTDKSGPLSILFFILLAVIAAIYNIRRPYYAKKKQ